MDILAVIFAHAPSKSMKYLGPKANIDISIMQKKDKLLMHHIRSLKKLKPKINIIPYIILGFGNEKIVPSLIEKDIDFCVVPDYEEVSHGTIIKRIMQKYDPNKFDGILFSHDIGFNFSSNIKIDTENNFVFTTKSKKIESNISCHIVDGLVYNMFYDISDTLWTGCLFLSKESSKLLKHINTIYNLEKLLTIEIINFMIETKSVFKQINLKEKDFIFINTQRLKKNAVKTKGS